jgi:hypothetical protein
MRSPRLPDRAALGLSAALALTGCNAIFGLDPVAQRGDTGGGGGASSSASSSVTGGGGALCPLDSVDQDLLVNSSFEDTSAWTAQGKDVIFDTVPAEDCAFACGARSGHLELKAGGGEGSASLYQDITGQIDLGGTFELSGHYRFAAKNAPYFSVTSNGYDVGKQYIYGTKDGDHLVLDKFLLQVLDPRRTGEHLRVGLAADYDDTGMSASLDCLSLTYRPPQGEQVLLNGWLEGGTAPWFAASNTELVPAAPGAGLCGGGAGHVTVAASEPNAEISSFGTGAWPVGTTFRFGGALSRFPDPMGPVTLNFSLDLSVTYADDGDPATQEYMEFPTGLLATSEAWRGYYGELVTKRPVVSAGLRQRAANLTASPAEYLVDCFSIRAIPPP